MGNTLGYKSDTATKAKKNARKAERTAKQKAMRERFEEEVALRTEQIHEEMAPAAQRSAVTQRTIDRETGEIIERELRAALADYDEKRGGYRRATTLWKMHCMDDRKITSDHLRAAKRFCMDYERGVTGAQPSSTVDGVFIDKPNTVDPSRGQMDALKRYRQACDVMGPLRIPVEYVAIWDWSITKVAQAMRRSQKEATGYLSAGLDLLLWHYWPDKAPTRIMPVVVAVPMPLVVDVRVTDIPQERLGRVNAA